MKPYYSGLLTQDLKNDVDRMYYDIVVKAENVSFLVMIDLHPSRSCYIYNVESAEVYQNTTEYDVQN